MNTLPMHAQVQTWMGLNRQQLLSAIVLLALLAALAIALMGAAYYASGTTASADRRGTALSFWWMRPIGTAARIAF
jgi:hypothetical protein